MVLSVYPKRRAPTQSTIHYRQSRLKVPYRIHWPRVLLQRQLLARVNLFVCILLIYHTFHRIVFSSKPHPITHTPILHTPGYAHIRHATFRYPYPCNTLNSCIDRIFVIVDSSCDVWEEFQKLADENDMPVHRWDTRNVAWDSYSTIPLSSRVMRDLYRAPVEMKRKFNHHMRYYDAHYRLWRHIVEKKWQRVLVLDVTTFPSERLIHSLPDVLNNVDVESVARQKPWHLIQFEKVRDGAFWTNVPHEHKSVAEGLQAYLDSYVLSYHGATYFLGIKQINLSLEKDVADLKGVYLGFDTEMERLGKGSECFWRRKDQRLVEKH